MKFQILVIRLLSMILYMLAYEVLQVGSYKRDDNDRIEFRFLRVDDLNNLINDGQTFVLREEEKK